MIINNQSSVHKGEVAGLRIWLTNWEIAYRNLVESPLEL